MPLLPSLFVGGVSALTGDSACSGNICMSATVQDSQVQYEMTYSLFTHVGWIAIGFGTRMADSAMVVMGANANESVTLSQRTATGDVYPQPATKLSRIAAVAPGATSTTTAPNAFAFTVSTDGTTSQLLIWAYITISPNSSSPNSTLAFHDDAGTFILDLTKSLSTASASGSTSGSASLISAFSAIAGAKPIHQAAAWHSHARPPRAC